MEALVLILWQIFAPTSSGYVHLTVGLGQAVAAGTSVRCDKKQPNIFNIAK